MARKLRLAKKCIVCGKIIAHWNKSGYCSYHLKEEHLKKPEVIKNLKETQKRYYQKHKERIKIYQKAYHDLIRKKKLEETNIEEGNNSL